MSEDEIEPTAHNVLKAIYLNPDEPTTTRLRAAAIAIGYERPKLSSVVSHSFTVNMSIGSQLSRAAERLREHRMALVAAGMDPKEAYRKAIELKAEPIEIEDNKKGGPDVEPPKLLGLPRRI